MIIRTLINSAAALSILIAAPAQTTPESDAQAVREIEKNAAPRETSNSVTPRRTLYGLTRPGREVVLSAPFEGVLMDLYVDEGQTVAKGELLGTMDDRVAKAAVASAGAKAQADADVAYARLELSLAELLLKRTKESHASKAASPHELDEARIRRDQAAASLKSAEQAKRIAERNLTLEQTRLENHRIRAPFAGRVTRVYTDSGATIATSDDVLKLVSLRTLHAELFLPVELYGVLQAGESCSLTASEPVSGAIEATLLTAEPIIDPATRTFRCVFEIHNPDENLPAGFTVQLEPTTMQRLLSRATRQPKQSPSVAGVQPD